MQHFTSREFIARKTKLTRPQSSYHSNSKTTREIRFQMAGNGCTLFNREGHKSKEKL